MCLEKLFYCFTGVWKTVGERSDGSGSWLGDAVTQQFHTKNTRFHGDMEFDLLFHKRINQFMAASTVSYLLIMHRWQQFSEVQKTFGM